ncbi:MAG: DoxX family protein [Acidimicrobiales bacterium]
MTAAGEAAREDISIAGHPAKPAHDDEGWRVEWPVDGGRLLVGGTGLGRDEVVAAAQVASVDPAIDPAGLPDGFVELAHGPLDAALGAGLGDGLGYVGASSGVALAYADGEDPGSSIGVLERPGSASAVDLGRLALTDAEATTRRGHHAVLARDEADVRSVVVQWLEPPGLLVSVMASGLSDAEVVRVAEELTPAGDGEVEALVRDHPFEDAEARFIALDDGQTLVAEGENDRGPWRLVATDRPDEAGLDLRFVDGGSGFGWGDGAPTDDALAFSTTGIDTRAAAVFGVVDGSAASVTVEAPGRPPIAVELHAVEGWTYRRSWRSHRPTSAIKPRSWLGWRTGRRSAGSRSRLRRMASHLRVEPRVDVDHGGPGEPSVSITLEPRGDRRARLSLAAFMAGSGIMHFLVPGRYERIVPRWLGDPRRVVVASGVAELACGALLFSRRTANAGGWLTAAPGYRSRPPSSGGLSASPAEPDRAFRTGVDSSRPSRQIDAGTAVRGYSPSARMA